MWVFTKYGFYSVVCAHQGDGSFNESVDLKRVMVRARDRGHLEALRVRFRGLLGDAVIHEHVGTVYAYRIFVE